MTKIAIVGAGGRMGRALIESACKVRDVELFAAVDIPGSRSVGADAGAYAGLSDQGVTIADDLAAANGSDVMIDFTFHTAVPGNAGFAARNGMAAVIGTTGLDDTELVAVEQSARIIPIVMAPNMSLGVNLMFAMAEKSAAVLGGGYRVTISETHHVHKKDAPSGTALALGRKVALGLDVDFDSVMLHNPKESGTDPVPGRITILSRREGEVVGDHTVSYENEVERVEITHHAWSRSAFAMGAVHAAKWVVGRDPGLYTMQDVLDL